MIHDTAVSPVTERAAEMDTPTGAQKIPLRLALWVLIFGGSSRQYECFTGVLFFLWGLQFLLPYDAMSTSPVFAKMLSLLPEWVWGLIYMAVGGFQFYAVIPYRRLIYRQMACLAVLILAGWLMGLSFVSVPGNPAVVLYGLMWSMTVLSMFNVERGRERIKEKQAAHGT